MRLLFPTPCKWALPLAALALGGCAPDTPTWALDVLFVSPTGAGVTGTQTWQLYSNQWQRKFNDKHYLCSVLVTFDGAPIQPDCMDCLMAMDVVAEVTDTDCSEAQTADSTFTSTTRIGIGPPQPGGPFPGASSSGFIDYGSGWEVHGWAWPDALSQDEAVETPEWDGVQAFSMAPSFAWQLGAPGTAPVSRLAIEAAQPEGS